MKKINQRLCALASYLALMIMAVAAYTLMGIQWPVGTDVSYYINANTPQVADEADAVISAANSWSQIHPSGLKLSYHGSSSETTYGYNSLNTVCWMDEGNTGALATAWTWYTGSTILETDMVFNEFYTWSTSGGTYDIQSVALHEFGHWVGLDHSATGIMRPNYSGIQHTLDNDAIAGFEAMYGKGGGEEDPPLISINISSLYFTGSQEKSFKIRNAGPGLLRYYFTVDKPWLDISPDNGGSTGEWNVITVKTSSSGITVGNHVGYINIFSDNADNSPQYITVILTVLEDKPPSVSIKAPKNNAVVSKIVTITAKASDDKGVKKVEFYINNKLKKSDSQQPYKWNWNTAPYPSGFQTVKARAYDTINQVTDHAIKVKIDHPPQIKISSPQAGEEVKGETLIKVSAKDDFKIRNVKFFINGQLQTTDTKPPYEYLWDTISVHNGEYIFKATVTDSRSQTAQDEKHVILIPHAPQSFTGSKANNSSVLLEQYLNILSWQPNFINRNITKYRVYLKEGSDWNLLVELPSIPQQYKHMNTEPERTYEYLLMAVDKSNREGEAVYLRLQ